MFTTNVEEGRLKSTFGSVDDSKKSATNGFSAFLFFFFGAE